VKAEIMLDGYLKNRHDDYRPTGLTLSLFIGAPSLVSLWAVFVVVVVAASWPAIAVSQVKDGVKEDPFNKAIGSIAGREFDSDLTAEEYLRRLAAKEFDVEQADRLVEKLGSKSYKDRQDAFSRLCVMPILSLDFEKLASSKLAPEIKWRLDAIKNTRSATDSRLLTAALKSVETRAVPGVFEHIKTLFCRGYLSKNRRAYQSAFLASATANDRKRLARFATDENADIRQWSATALVKFLGKEAIDLIEPQLSDADEKTRLLAAALLVDLGHRPAVTTLMELLMSKEHSISSRSWRMIKVLTGENFGYLPYQANEVREAQVKKCRDWMAINGDTFELKIPMAKNAILSSNLQGNTLLAINGSSIVEYDPAREKVVDINCDGIGGADKTDDGNYIVHSYSSKYLREIDSDGKVIWQIEGVAFNNSVVTDSGSVLVTIGSSKLVREYDRETRKVIFEKKFESWTNDAVRMANGNTLVAEHKGVAEIDAEGNEVWRYPSGGNGTCVACRALPDGNVLIGWTNGNILEVNRDKEIVWEKKAAGYIHDIHRDENGHTIVMTQKSLKEYDVEGTVIWTLKKGEQFGTVRR